MNPYTQIQKGESFLERDVNQYGLHRKKEETSVWASIPSTLVGLGFVALVIVAIVQAREAKNKCGQDGDAFFVWMAVRLGYQLAEFIILALAMCCGMGFAALYSHSSVNSNTIDHSFMYLGPAMILLKLLLNIACLVVGTLFTSKVWSNEECKAAMANDSFTKAPLLPILGWFFVGVDSLLCLLICCAGVMGLTAARFS